MDNIFKQKLLSLRNPTTSKTFGEALLGDGSWLKKTPKAVTKAAPAKEVFTERTQVIESLERFAQEKVENQSGPVIKFNGGEIHIKAEPGWEGLSHFSDLNALKSSLSLGPNLLDLVLTNKQQGEVKIIFVSEKFRAWDEVSTELKSGFIDELIAGFPLKTAELFSRMISAMKLGPKEVVIYPVEGLEEQDYSKEVMEIASYFRPEVVVT